MELAEAGAAEDTPATTELVIRGEASAEVTLLTPKQVQTEVEAQLGDLLCVLGQEEQKVSVLSDELITLGRDPQSILAKYGLDDASLDAVRDFSAPHCCVAGGAGRAFLHPAGSPNCLRLVLCLPRVALHSSS